MSAALPPGWHIALTGGDEVVVRGPEDGPGSMTLPSNVEQGSLPVRLLNALCRAMLADGLAPPQAAAKDLQYDDRPQHDAMLQRAKSAGFRYDGHGNWDGSLTTNELLALMTPDPAPPQAAPVQIPLGPEFGKVLGENLWDLMQGSAPPQAANQDPDSWEANAQHMLERCPYTVWQRPGGGDLDLKATLVVTFQAMQMRLEGHPLYANSTVAQQAERERLKTIAHNRAGYEAASAAHHAGKCQPAFEMHMTRNAAMCDLIEVLFGPKGA